MTAHFVVDGLLKSAQVAGGGAVDGDDRGYWMNDGGSESAGIKPTHAIAESQGQKEQEQRISSALRGKVSAIPLASAGHSAASTNQLRYCTGWNTVSCIIL